MTSGFLGVCELINLVNLRKTRISRSHPLPLSSQLALNNHQVLLPLFSLWDFTWHILNNELMGLSLNPTSLFLYLAEILKGFWFVDDTFVFEIHTFIAAFSVFVHH